MSRPSKLLEIIERLREAFGDPAMPDITDPLEQILFEQVAYLTTDDKRVAAFETLRERTGLSPRRILEAKEAELIEISSVGGAAIAETRASRIRDTARIVIQNWEGDLSPVLQLSFDKARRILSGFAMIGEPGADRILLFAGASNRLALDSNGLRALLRIGYGSEYRDYKKSYRSVVEQAEGEMDDQWETAYRAHMLFKQLGREVCKRSTPRCEACPLTGECAYFSSNQQA